MPIKVITIDFWNTLFDSSGGSERNDLRLRTLIAGIDKFGLIIKKDEFNDALKLTWEYFNQIWFSEQRTPPPSETIGYFWNKLNLPVDERALNDLIDVFSESILTHPPKLLAGAKHTLERLSMNYNLGIVSDTGFSPGNVLRQLLKRNDIYDYFSEFSFSDETGVSKPNSLAYLKILNFFNCKPEEALHIGDIEKTDILGAKNLGMKAILFSGDSTGVSRKFNDSITLSDAEAFSWNEIPQLIDIF